MILILQSSSWSTWIKRLDIWSRNDMDKVRSINNKMNRTDWKFQLDKFVSARNFLALLLKNAKPEGHAQCFAHSYVHEFYFTCCTYLIKLMNDAHTCTHSLLPGVTLKEKSLFLVFFLSSLCSDTNRGNNVQAYFGMVTLLCWVDTLLLHSHHLHWKGRN